MDHDGEAHGKEKDAPVVLDPFDLALYTDAYKQRVSQEDALRGSLHSWNKFTAAKPLLYLPGRSTNTDFDAKDRSRHLWTVNELHEFGGVVEMRAQELLAAQETLLKSWHFNATQVEKVVRGFLGRQHVKRIRLVITQVANQLELAQYLAWLRKKQLVGAVTFQLAYHRHRRYRQYIEACCVRVQRATRLFLFRLHRWRAVRKLQRAVRCYQYRKRMYCHLRKLCTLLRASRQKQELEQCMTAFTRIQDVKRRQEQARLWVTHPEQMAQLLRVQQRKYEIGAAMQLPLLPHHHRQQRSTDRSKPSRDSNSSSWGHSNSSGNQSASTR
uniref:Uncharacterized protein n=1 Tax=Globisporangium ultimum (strain ATCC 200006 / CBS 805.95 / DAOM BR144) TaxID=431595 RepID=K3WGX1_GLOUD